MYKATVITKSSYVQVQEEIEMSCFLVSRHEMIAQYRNIVGKVQVKLAQKGWKKTYPGPKYTMNQVETELVTMLSVTP